MMDPVEHGVIVRPSEHIRIVTQPDYSETDGTPRGAPRRMHLFRVPDSRPSLHLFSEPDAPRWREVPCGGKAYCRECMREAGR